MQQERYQRLKVIRVSRREKNEITILNEINEKLDKILATLVIQGKDKEKQINILVSLGFPNSEISKLTGMPKGTVDTIRAKSKKKTKNKKKVIKNE